MAIKKSELYSSIWKSCDELRGGMDASQYKDYVLVLLFVKCVSDKYAGQSHPLIEVPEGGGFADMAVLKGDKEIGEWKDNTLSIPYFKHPDGSLKTFDYVVANPPFSSKSWSNGFDPANDLYRRFEDGIPPAKNGDYAFLLHILRSMKSTGKGAVILPHGVLFRGNAEADIRRNIVRKGYIKGIIGLPANLFYGTGIPACIIVLDKEHAARRSGVFMIDASRGFMKDGNKNRLRHQDIHKIVDVFNRQLELPGYARMVSLSEIEANDYNLNIPRYIDASEPEDTQDIEAHLLGGILDRDIDDLTRYWEVFPTLKSQLFTAGARPGYSELRVAPTGIRSTIFNHPEFTAYTCMVHDLFEKWKANNRSLLMDITMGSHPKALIERLSEDILEVFSPVRLIDKYDVYQRLMSYWTDTMQDDVYLIASEGWVEANRPRPIIEDRDKKIKEKPDLVVGKLKYRIDLIPPALLIARCFSEDKQLIETLETALATVTQKIEEMIEEHSGEDGLLEDLKDGNGAVSPADVTARLKEIANDSDTAEEQKVLNDYLELLKVKPEIVKSLRAAQKALDEKVAARYTTLTVDEIKDLVVNHKWLAALAADVQAELDRVSQALAGRIRELAERYAAPLPQLSAEVDALNARVDEHLKKMGHTVCITDYADDTDDTEKP